MSTHSHRHREHNIPPTDPKWYPVTRGLNKWLNRMAHRNDLTVRVLRGNIGAPARYVPNRAEIDFAEALLERLDPSTVGSQDFVIDFPVQAGGGVHEAAHARFSTFDLPKINKVHGPRHAQTFALLEEARCESLQWDSLTASERDALQTLVLDLVLKETLPEDGSEPDFDDPRLLLRLVGLTSGRFHTGIINASLPKAQRLRTHIETALGDDVFATFDDLAVRFASTPNDNYYGRGENQETMHQIVRDWIEAEDALIPPPEENEGGGGGDSDDSEEGEEGDSTSKSKPGDGDGEEDGAAAPGEDDEGEAGDGSHTITEGEGDASLGGYASSNIDAGALEDIFGDLAAAAEEAQKVAGSRLKKRSGDIRKAVAADHQRRRELNKEAMKRWR